MLNGIISSLIYTAIGVALFILAYYLVVVLLKRKHDVNEQIDNHNVAAGIAVAGLFVAIAIVISGAVQ